MSKRERNGEKSWANPKTDSFYLCGGVKTWSEGVGAMFHKDTFNIGGVQLTWEYLLQSGGGV